MTTDEHLTDRIDATPGADLTIRVRPDDGEHLDVASTAKRAAVGLVVTIGALLLLGAVGSLFVFDSAIGSSDFDAVAWVADRRVGVLDTVATIGSTLSDTWTVIGVMVGSASMLWATGHVRPAVTVVLGVSIELTTFLVVGAIIDRPRPDVETLHSVPSTSSFPSGHVAAAFVLYGSLVLATRSVTGREAAPRLWFVSLVIATVVAASRVYEGVHHPIDVVAGLVLGALALAAAGHATGLVTFWARRRNAEETDA